MSVPILVKTDQEMRLRVRTDGQMHRCKPVL